MGNRVRRKVSVCMATYNGEKYIFEQMKSILMQLNVSDEVIVSDDGSRDKTLSIIENIKDQRVCIFKNEFGPNLILNIENALKKATGDYIFLSDQDDIWLEDKVNMMTLLLNKYDLVVSDCMIINEKEEIIKESFFEIIGKKRGIIRNLYKNPYLGCCMAFKKEVLGKALPFPKNIPMHDIWLGFIGELYGKTYFYEGKLVKYRRHISNTSPTTGVSKNALSWKIYSRIRLIYHLIKRRML